MGINKRQSTILLLLNKSKGPITANWISKELNVSDRTVRNEINNLRKECKSLGIEIESIRGKGYDLKIIDPTLFKEALNLYIKDDTLTNHNRFTLQSNRVKYLLQRLLLAKDFIKMEKLEAELFVSRSTLKNDLKLVNQELEKFQLVCISKPYYGKKVHGEEYMKRLCLSNSILDNHDIFKEKTVWFRFIDMDLFNKIKDIIIEIVNDYSFEISDLTLENLATHIAIACKRIEDNFIIEQLNIPLADGYTVEKSIANKIIQRVECFTGLNFPRTEEEYILVHLLGTKLLSNKRNSNDSIVMNEIVRDIVIELKEIYDWDFYSDLEFIQGLSSHLGPVMNRLKYGMNIHNPLLNDIKLTYPLAFEGAIVASRCIKKYIDKEINEHEISYIAMYIQAALERIKGIQKYKILVVCATGVGSAKLLYYQLEDLFGQKIEIVDTISFYKLPSFSLSGIDFIISTVPINRKLKTPVIVVNPFLKDEDINTIGKQVNTCDNILSFIDLERIFVHEELKNQEAVIQFLCNKLYEQGLVKKNYATLVLKRESVASTYFGNLVAIPHPITPQTSKTFWTICTLKAPILWNNQNMVQLVCLLNVEKDGAEDLSSMYESLIHLIKSNSIVREIINSKSPQQIAEILSEQIKR
ncbi:BglG family transcription antiterminator [Virgibacillus pantothenticus]|uniref:BglG family transcription antiterminator n=1 Tax=Virgibacillus pantothenticus TaxID=1473 RepID=UPI000984A38D|nr:BglG family transcription antiterminator [Virgibacillus pantothenticus]